MRSDASDTPSRDSDTGAVNRLEQLRDELTRQKVRASDALKYVEQNLQQPGRELERSLSLSSQGVANLLAARAAAERLAEAKSRALDALAHDLRTPLQVIVLAIEKLRRRELSPDEEAPHWDRIDEAVDHIEASLATILQMARMTTEPRPALETISLGAFLGGVCQAAQPLAEAKALSLRCVATSVRVRSDPGALASILQNLIGNAIKYTDRGSVLIGCRRRGGGATVEIQVCDTGRGIPADAVGRVFEEFTQLNSSAPGVGLGLAIARRHANSLGHELTCASAVGRGSCFGVRLPRVADAGGDAGE